MKDNFICVEFPNCIDCDERCSSYGVCLWCEYPATEKCSNCCYFEENENQIKEVN